MGILSMFHFIPYYRATCSYSRKYKKNISVKSRYIEKKHFFRNPHNPKVKVFWDVGKEGPRNKAETFKSWNVILKKLNFVSLRDHWAKV